MTDDEKKKKRREEFLKWWGADEQEWLREDLDLYGEVRIDGAAAEGWAGAQERVCPSPCEPSPGLSGFKSFTHLFPLATNCPWCGCLLEQGE